MILLNCKPASKQGVDRRKVRLSIESLVTTPPRKRSRSPDILSCDNAEFWGFQVPSRGLQEERLPVLLFSRDIPYHVISARHQPHIHLPPPLLSRFVHFEIARGRTGVSVVSKATSS